MKILSTSPRNFRQIGARKHREQTIHINTLINAIISECSNQNLHSEAIAIILFSQWMRLSVFFGISESEWQKMDYYLPDILKAVRSYLCSIGTPVK